MISALDLFRIGVGPSSSHTVGPIRIANAFLEDIQKQGELEKVARITVELQGSLALTGPGHGTPDACIMGLSGFEPETIDVDAAREVVERVEAEKQLMLLGRHNIDFDQRRDIDLACHVIPELHPNGVVMNALDEDGHTLCRGEFYSTGGGFFASADVLRQAPDDDLVSAGRKVRYPFTSAEELLGSCAQEQLSIAQIVHANEAAFRDVAETQAGLDHIASAMMDCIHAGLAREGDLPGSLKVKRRARGIYERLRSRERANEAETLMDWLNLFAMAVNEENASGNRVVTAPTNGAAGIIPAVIRYYCYNDGKLDAAKARDFLLTAAGIGLLYKQRASISGAEMGCQGEVGVACSMAAGGLAAIWGGEPFHVAAAAEIGMEHNLGLTCDPVGGLVQIPCIERNALAAVKAVNAARLALHAGSEPRVSLDQVIETMRQTGIDMSNKYKETSLGGLAVNVVAC